MNQTNAGAGHLAAAFSVVVWGTTFISTKLLLVSFTPVEILVFRFCIGFLALCAAYPRPMKGPTPRQQLLLAAAGLCGVTLYFLFENIALTYTLASNVGVIISAAPMFTALLGWLLYGERPTAWFFTGFAAAMAGIFLITFNGNVVLQLNPTGDILALLAAVVWAFYSILTKKISTFGYHTIQTTRRIFLYGLLLMLPALFFFPFRLGLERFTQPANLLHILFLGLGASALCFVSWNFALKRLGALKTSLYIYLVPVVTIVTSVLVLHETITPLAALGTALTVAGLFLSERKPKRNT